MTFGMTLVLWMTFQSEIVIAGMITAQLSMIKFWHTVISAARKTWGKKETCSDISAQKLAFLRISDWWCDLDIPDQSHLSRNHQFCSGSSCFSVDSSKGKEMMKMVSGRIFLMGPLQTGLQRHALMTKRLSVQCEVHSCIVLVTATKLLPLTTILLVHYLPKLCVCVLPCLSYSQNLGYAVYGLFTAVVTHISFLGRG